MLNIYVGNLNFDTSPDQVREAFEQFGEVLRVYLPTDRETGRPRGFGFVEMKNDDEARKAIEELNGADLEGRSLRVNEARPREESGSRGGGGFGGGGGGRRGGGGFGGSGGGGRRGGGGGERRGRGDQW